MELFGGCDSSPVKKPTQLRLKSKKFYKSPPRQNLSEKFSETAIQDNEENLSPNHIPESKINIPSVFSQAPVQLKNSSQTNPDFIHKTDPHTPTQTPLQTPLQRNLQNTLHTTLRTPIQTPIETLIQTPKPIPITPAQTPITPAIPQFNGNRISKPVFTDPENKIHPFFKNQAPVPQLSTNKPRSRNSSGLNSTSTGLNAKSLQPSMTLDFGQTSGSKTCKHCGMTFNRTILSDKDAHRIYHSKALNATQFPKNIPFSTTDEIELLHNNPFNGQRIIQVKNTLYQGEFYKKFVELRKFVDEELGSNVSTTEMIVGQRGYVYLNSENCAMGFLLAGTVVNTETNNVRRIKSGTGIKNKDWFMGVQVLWVAKNYRRKGFAKELLDMARETFFYGMYIKIDEIAFSDTTEDGNQFSIKYCDTSDYNVYQFRSPTVHEKW